MGILLNDLKKFLKRFFSKIFSSAIFINRYEIFSGKFLPHFKFIVHPIHFVPFLAMKLFQACQEYMAIIGVRPLLPGEKHPFNRQNVRVLLVFGLAFILTSAFLIFDAQTLRQYAECFYAWSSVFAIFVGVLLVILKTEDLFQLINDLEIMIQNSKWLDCFRLIDIEHGTL